MYGGSPTNNYGTSTYLRVLEASSDYQSYLKFDVTGISGTVTHATLRVFAYDGSDAGGSAFAVSDNGWTETGITWNNKPAFGSLLSTVSGTIPNDTWVQYDVTGAVSGNGTYSFGMSTTSGNSLYLRSREYPTEKPELVIQVGSY